MRFSLIDRIVDLRPGASIGAVKTLSLAEEYLQDHFPLFPVMPGVLMLEAMYQTSAWLLRYSDNFEFSMVVLKEARNVKYADFVEPGEVLHVAAEITKTDGPLTWLKAQGVVDGNVAVSARLALSRYNLADEEPTLAATDQYTRKSLREEFERLFVPAQEINSVC